MHFILKKIKAPSMDPNPTYGPYPSEKSRAKMGKSFIYTNLELCTLIVNICRTMSIKQTNCRKGVNSKMIFGLLASKVLRAMWIDELPQLINFFKGELSLVGVRALSEHYLSLYPPDMQELRLKMKPGLMPPFYADMPVSFEEIVESEKKVYPGKKWESPFLLTGKYFWKGVWNIIFNHARSY